MGNQAFKSYSRGYREQSTEETFKEGQVFTRAPLDSGKSRLIVNYDINSDGDALSNRKGLRVNMLASPFKSVLLNPAITSDLCISQCSDAVEEDNGKYRLVVANQFKDTDEKVSGTNLRKAPSELWVINMETDPYSYLSDIGIDCRNLYAMNLNNKTGESDAKGYYKYINETKVHGMNLKQSKYLGSPVGCFAFGNDYYSFNTKGKLMRTTYTEADQALGTSAVYSVEEVEPKTTTATEAMSYGFNMLLDNPYVFSDEYDSGTIKLDGVIVYDGTKMVTEPLINTSYTLRCFYTVEKGKKYKIVWQYRAEDTNTWNDIEEAILDVTSSPTELPTLVTDSFSCPIENAIIRVQAYKYSGSSYESTPEKTYSLGIEFAKSASLTSKKELINYDLSKASGMVYWKNYLWLYGLAQAPTVLFCSDIDEPAYFPYPNNIDLFDEPIIHCAPYNESLLVFTKTQLIQLTLSDEKWSTKLLQGNLNFTDADARCVQIVKNMVFFKSGDYYYMIVPKTLSLQNELALAPVSKNIEYFLDTFEDNVKTLFEIMYEYEGTLELINYYNYLNYEDVHNVYVFETDENVYLNLALLYNTVNRTWRIYTYQSDSPYYPLKQDATKTVTLVAPFTTSTNKVGVQFIGTDKASVSDMYFTKEMATELYTEISDDEEDIDANAIKEMFSTKYKFKNWQVLDTGYRNDIIDLNKRYRELQIKFNNVSSALLKFITEFILDGETRIGRYKYETEHITDPTSPNYGLITITRTPVENIEVPGGSALASSSVDVNAWTLDSSRFPEVAYWKARLKVSGKGYTPRFRLICRTEEIYELLGYTWVYRTMYSR